MTSYLPLQKVTRVWSDRVKQLQIPLFPNYLFVYINQYDRAKVLQVSGVSRFVTFMGKPAVIPEQEIEMIRRLENEEPEIESDLVNGDVVQITRGPFCGMKGVLFSRKGRKRFGVRLEILKRSLSVEICGSILCKI